MNDRRLLAVCCALLSATIFAQELSDRVAQESRVDGWIQCQGSETVLLQSRIDTLARQGGGTLVVSGGVHQTGALFFKAGVNLHLEEGAVLLGSDDESDYPKGLTRIEGETCLYYPAIINADHCDGFTISGKGVVDGHGFSTWETFWRELKKSRENTGTAGCFRNKDLMRPRVLYVSNSKNVDVSGVTFRNSKFWTSHFYNCDNVVVHDCTFLAEVVKDSGGHELKGPSTDAVDIDKCRNFTVRGCRISVNDDGIAVKGGKGAWADNYARHPENGPSSNVLVEDCVFQTPTHSCLTIGSECPEACDVVMRNCRMAGVDDMLYLKMRTDTPQRYSRIRVEGVTGDCRTFLHVGAWKQYADLGGRSLAEVKSYARDITLRNCRVTCAIPFVVKEDPAVFELADLKLGSNEIRSSYGSPTVSDNVACRVAHSEIAAGRRTCRPETWFHLIGGNVSYEGLTADLEAIKAAGIGGIHLFHGQIGDAEAWPGVSEQIPCLSEKWDDMVSHVAAECRRLGLVFKMQNCPGWSMSGGPWITPRNAMRNLCYSRTSVRSGEVVSLPLPDLATDNPERDYHDLFVVAFPTPQDDDDGWLVPKETTSLSAQSRLFAFDKPVTVRTIELPSMSELNHDRTYDPETIVCLEAEIEPGVWREVVREALPPGNWQDNRKGGSRYTISCDEATALSWRLTLDSSDPVRLGDVRLSSAARMEHWEGLAGWTLRGLVRRSTPKQNPACWVDRSALVDLTGHMQPDGSLNWVPPDKREWTVLRVGHVNGLYRNGPAPKEATGWECSKLSKRGIEANYAAYIGRLANGPLRGRIDGMVVDSWECFRDNWTDGLDVEFEGRLGYGLVRWLPAIFGWVVGSPSETESFLRDWRGLLGKLVEENYYGRMAELAHADGLTVQCETSFGDALFGDLLEFWKHSDIPMCEFWRPTMQTGVGSANFKPVLPCVSAAHVYGKRRVAAEALTNCALTWNESLCDFKPVLDRHFAKGVTFPVFHTYTHNPQVGFKRPGTSFGYFIGTPFLRGQTWWPFMPCFTDYCARCTEFLEAGKPVVDILRVLGDGLGHKPDEKAPHFDNRFKDDYVNQDVLLNRLSVKDGRLVLPDGMSYSVLWIPKGTYLDSRSRCKIADLRKAGARIADETDPTVDLAPDVVSPDGSLLWYHRETEEGDRYFVAAPDAPVQGMVAFRGRDVALELEAGESRFVSFSCDGVCTVVDPVTGRVPVSRPKGIPCELTGYEQGATHASFVFTAERGECVVVDFGQVEQCAEVCLNGVSVGKLWCAPYRLDLTGLVKEGENRLDVAVTATWHNRLVDEASKPKSERTTWTLYGPKPDAKKQPAGLLGKVSLWKIP